MLCRLWNGVQAFCLSPVFCAAPLRQGTGAHCAPLRRKRPVLVILSAAKNPYPRPLWAGAGRVRAGRRGRRPLRRGTAETSRSCHSERSEESVTPSPAGGRGQSTHGASGTPPPTAETSRICHSERSEESVPPSPVGGRGQGTHGASGTPPPTAKTSRPCHSERSEESVPPSPAGRRRRETADG